MSHLHPQQLAAQVIGAVVERSGIDPARIDDVIWGTNMQVGKQASNVGRMGALLAGLPDTVGGVTMDRACGAGITSVSFATASIGSDNEDAIIAGGTEMMSYTNSLPLDGYHHANRDPALLEQHPLSHQGVAADAIAG
ncbi:MAG: acetyl-CoA C-acyltransferase, partial [Tardiphaga sp.]